MTEDDYRRKAEALLRLAAQTDNMKRRSELIGEATHWHMLAMDAHEHPRGESSANDDQDRDEAYG